jgi:mannose-6-phosphate isomerase-like protein (cupin superfamily)
MRHYPDFMRVERNAVHPEDQTEGAEGYIFDGIDGSQMIIWTSRSKEPIKTTRHTHDYDEWFLIIDGNFKGDIGGSKAEMGPGDEIHIPAGTPHNGTYSSGFRSIHAFSKKRARRMDEK